MSDFTIECGKAHQLLSNLRHAKLIFADPPFNINYHYSPGTPADNLSPQDYGTFTLEWMNAASAALDPDGVLCVAINFENVQTILNASRFSHLVLHDWVIWNYSFGQHSKTRWGRDHTHILIFRMKNGKPIFNADAVRVPSLRQSKYRDKRAAGLRVPGNVWHIPRICGTFKERCGWHPCQMPLAVLNRLVLAYSNPGDLVADPFLGSGTTLVAAKLNRRRGWGCDINEGYAAKAQERIYAVESLEPTPGATANEN